MSGVIASLTKREALAFKAGGWASIPVDYAVENYAIPAAKKLNEKTEKKFYSHISKFGKSKSGRRLTKKAMPLKRTYHIAGAEAESIAKRLRSDQKERLAMFNGIIDKKVATSQLNASSLSAHNTQDTQLFNLNQGTQMGQRVGRIVTASKVDVNCYARNLNNTNTLYLRVLVMCDKKPQVGTTNTKLFNAKGDSNDPIDFGLGATMDSIRNPINSNRFTVYSDRRFKLAPNLADNQGDNSSVFKYSIKLKRKIEYLASTVPSSVDRVNPNIILKYWIEKDDGSAGTSLCDVAMDIYQHFIG